MQAEWKTFLLAHGAVADVENGLPDFANRPAGETNGICDLGVLGLIQVEGNDARDFLQAQTSSDLARVANRGSSLSSISTPKGRMLALFRIIEWDGRFLLQLPLDRVAAIVQRLSMFLLRSDAAVSNASDTLIRLGVMGDGPAATLEKICGGLPGEPETVVSAPQQVIVRHPGQARYQFITDSVDLAREVWETLTADYPPLAADAWLREDIFAGIPTVYTATAEAFVAQMANLELLGGVGFKKGCYPGQEIIARTQYLGKQKRRMFRLHAERSAAPGDSIVFASGDNTQSQGTVVDARPDPDGGCDLLAVLRIEAAQGEQGLRLNEPSGPALSLRDLPYTLDRDVTVEP